MKLHALIVVLLAVLLAACGLGSPETPPDAIHIRLPMGYIPNVQFAPFYVALEKGYFLEEGIELDFDYAFETDGISLVGSGDLQFSLGSGDQVLLARAQGIPVVYVMAWWNQFPVAIVAHAESGITSPADLVGKRVGIPIFGGASYVGYQAIMKEAGVSSEEVNLEAIGFNQVESLLAGIIDAAVVYVVNEPVQLEAQGFPTTTIAVKDYVDLASNGLITNQATISNDPELVRKMIRAVLRGLRDTLDDPEAAFAICAEYVEGLEGEKGSIQYEVLLRSLEYWKADPLGYSRPAAWENMQQVLMAMDLLTDFQDVHQAYTNEYLP